MQCCGSRPPLARRSIAAWPIVVGGGLVLAVKSSAGALPHSEQCENNDDDDGDGKIDFRAEPGRIPSVRAPSGSRVALFCEGALCPPRRELVRAGTRTVRVREFERPMAPGVALRIYVIKPGFVGTHTRFRFGRGRLPLRNDGCSSIAGRSRSCPGS